MKAISTLILLLIFINSTHSQRFLPLVREGSDLLEYTGPNEHLTDLTVYNNKLLFCGKFELVDNQPRNHLCYWNGDFYEAFDHTLPALASLEMPYGFLHDEQGLIIYGRMDVVNNIVLHTETGFNQIGDGLNERVHAAVQFNNEIIVAGRFTGSGESELAHVARWNGSAWVSMGDGFNDDVYDLLVFNGELYAAGKFISSGSAEVLRIAKWNGESWEQVGQGLDDTAYALEVHADELFVGGNFDASGDGLTPIYSLAKLNDEDLVSVSNTDPGTSFLFLHSFEGMLHCSGGNWTYQIPTEGYVLVNDDLQALPPNYPAIKDNIFYDNLPYVASGSTVHEGDQEFYLSHPLLIYEPFGSIIDWNETNKLRAEIIPSGSLFNSFYSSRPAYNTIPSNEPLSTIYALAPWMGGIVNEELYMNYVRFHNYEAEDLNRYYFGPFSDRYDHEYLKRYMRVWKVTSDQIEDHMANFDSDEYEMPETISHWPGNGRVEYGESSHLAPFVDSNENGWYEPHLGDYPLIKGDEAVYFILSTSRDGIAANYTTGFEIGVMAYSFEDDEATLENTLFMSYSITNRSSLNYEEVNFGIFADKDIGTATDDYVGCFPEEHMIYGYNGDAHDESSFQSSGYADSIPCQSVSFLSDDLYASIYYNNSSGINGEPSISLDHYRYLNAIWKNGQHVVFGGDGFSAATGADLQIPVNFMFNEDPLQPGSDENAWSEISAGNPPGDRRQVGSIQPFPLAPGETKCVDIALITAFPEVAGDWIQSSLPLLRERNQFIREFYANQNFDCAAEQFPLELEELSLSVDLKLYPNPSRSELFIEGLSEENSQVIVYDLSGRQVMDIQLARSSGSFDISHLDQGIYLAQIVQNDQVLGTRKFIKVN